MYYTIYKVINKITGKYYIGKHQTTNLNDDYLGSGKLIRQSIKKHGKDNFQKEILFIFDSEEEMNAKEKELVNENLVLNEKCYNVGIGGEGGPHFKGKTHSPETIDIIKKTSHNYILSEKSRKLISENNKKRYVNGENIGMCGKKHSEETKEKIRKTLRDRAEASSLVS